MSKVVPKQKNSYENNYMCLKCLRRFSGSDLYSPLELLIPYKALIDGLLGKKKELKCPFCKSKKVIPLPTPHDPPITYWYHIRHW